MSTPSGNAQAPAPSRSVAARETLTPSQLAAARRGPQVARPAVNGPLAPPALALSFEGSASTQGLRPPDTHGAVGATQFVEVTNSKLEVFNKATGVKTKSVTLNSFCGYSTKTIFDPRAVYDKVWNRWVVSAEAFPETASGPQTFCLAISTGPDATGPFYIYRYNAPRGAASNFYDYPMLGMDQDAVIITANIFSSTNAYLGSNIYGAPKASLYNGAPFGVPVFSAGASGTLAPPVVETNDSKAFVLASPGGGSSLKLFSASNLGRSGASFISEGTVAVPAFSASPAASQPGTTKKLDVLNRFQDHSTQINGHVLNIQTVGTVPTAHWWQINGTAKTLVAHGLVFESTATHDFNPSVAGSPVGGTTANPIGRMFFSWTSTRPATAPVHNARVNGGGRLATDSTTVTPGSALFTSPTFYSPSTSNPERWGDYSSVTLDPTAVAGCAAGNRAYVVNEKINTTALWGSRFGRLGFC